MDDGSKDGFKEFIEQYHSATGLQIRAIYQQNQGPGAARNYGMSKAQGAVSYTHLNLGKNDYQIAGIDNARDIIREAYMAEKPGFILTTKEKSPIFEAGDKFSVVVLTGIQEEGIAPLNSVSAAIRTELIRKKKGEIIAKELTNAISGSESLLSVAQKANAEVMDATDVSFSSFQVPGVGIEPVLTAEVVTMKENEISKPDVYKRQPGN